MYDGVESVNGVKVLTTTNIRYNLSLDGWKENDKLSSGIWSYIFAIII